MRSSSSSSGSHWNSKWTLSAFSWHEVRNNLLLFFVLGHFRQNRLEQSEELQNHSETWQSYDYITLKDTTLKDCIYFYVLNLIYIPIRMAKIKKWEYQMLARMQRNWITHALLERTQSGTATQNRNVTVAYKTNYTLIILPSYFTQASENMFSQNLYTNMDSRFLHSIWKQLNILLWVKIYTMVNLYHGLLLSKKKKQRIGVWNDLDGSQRNCAQWKKRDTNILDFWKDKITELENWLVVARG